MLSRASRAGIRSLFKIAFALLLLGQAGIALWAQTDLKSTQQRLDNLEKCLGAGNPAVNKLRQGLLSGWGRWKQQRPPSHVNRPVTPPPPEYLDSLDRDLKACEAAREQNDETLRRAILDEVLQDVTIKADDCERFGMGRMIQVNVSTMRAGVAENGWVVFWKWMPSGPLETVETSMPGLTSPVSRAFPPGTYGFRAEKRVSSTEVKTTDTRTIIVGGTQSVDCSLSIE
jgi:hypothetical protein